MTTNDTHRTPARHLTPRETDRLLNHPRLPAHIAQSIWLDLEMEADCANEHWSEQMAEYGRATRYYTAWERYTAANPVYGPVNERYCWDCKRRAADCLCVPF